MALASLPASQLASWPLSQVLKWFSHVSYDLELSKVKKTEESMRETYTFVMSRGIEIIENQREHSESIGF